MRLSAAPRWLILADDLTGAADTAIAFASRGWAASVAWGGAAPEEAVLALDADSRRLPAPDAAARHVALLATHGPGRLGLFKKIDSTLRGQPAAELAATLRALPGRMALVAPAFPRQGRTTEQGRILLHGQALEETPLWAREHSYPSADLRAVLAGEGLRVRHAPIGALGGMLRAAIAEGIEALVCDAAEEADLAAIVQTARPFATRLLWVGSAGLAHALAEAEPGLAPAAPRPRVAGGILTVVGSLAEASRDGVALLHEDPALVRFTMAPGMLRTGPDGPGWRSAARAVAMALAAGQDVLATIAGSSEGPDVELTRSLAALLAGAPLAGAPPAALIATGGETALALLDAFGITSLRLLEEIEPGVPLGLARAMPVITKAGAFGDAGTLPRCLTYLRRLRAPENAA